MIWMCVCLGVCDGGKCEPKNQGNPTNIIIQHKLTKHTGLFVFVGCKYFVKQCKTKKERGKTLEYLR